MILTLAESQPFDLSEQLILEQLNYKVDFETNQVIKFVGCGMFLLQKQDEFTFWLNYLIPGRTRMLCWAGSKLEGDFNTMIDKLPYEEDILFHPSYQSEGGLALCFGKNKEVNKEDDN